ncbi:MAG: response regulator [Haloarculaceae archaeon]
MDSFSATIDVLHVDDDPDFAALVAEFLEREADAFDVETATSAADGLDRLTDGNVDCVVSDYDMPGMNGIEFLDAVRADYPDLPFVLYTGKGNEAVASEAIAAGVTDYLQKQTGSQQYELLANRVRNAVEQSRATQRAADLEDVRDTVADVNQALVRATSRAEIESRVCEILARADRYRFAWIGEADDERIVDVRASAGVERGYLDAVEITADDGPTGRGPTGGAIETEDLAVVQDVASADEYEPWREAALERGYRSSAAAPLVYDDTTYGVLNVYADRSGAFDDRECNLLTELAADVAHALHHQDVRQTLERERDRFQHLVTEIEHYAIFMMDPDGCVATWNAGAEQIKGYAAEEIVGTHYEAFFPEEAIEQDTPRQLLARAEREGAVRGRGWRVRKDGSRFWADFTLTALFDDAGDLRGFAKITHDMTDQREYEQRLERQNERLEEFASIVSHDLRNPLNVADGRVELAREECNSDHLEDAADAIELSLTLVDDLLTLARDDSDGNEEPVALAETAKWCWRNVDMANATLVVETDRQLVAVPARLKQLLDNLLSNAVDHGGEGVTVTVGDCDGGFYVADNGTGIPDDERERVFERGYTTDGGTGLGLDIVRECADAHGWDVRITDSATGGARFEITGVEVSDAGE